MSSREAEGVRVSRVSMPVNGTLAVVKLVADITGHSYARIADAVVSLGDIVSSMIGDWWGQRLMLRGDRGQLVPGGG